MGLFEPERTNSAPHPRKEPRFPEPLSRENLKKVFEGCVDYMERTVYLHGDRKRTVTVCYLLGMARNERLSDYVLRPLAQDPALSQVPEEELFARLQYGALYNLAANRRTTLDDVVNDLILGSCALFFPGRGDALTLPVVTEEKRSVGEPENEPALKGVRESFVESVRTNTAMVRRHLKAPELKIREHIVGRRSRTQVDVLYLDGIADPDTVERVRRRLDGMDIDGVEAAGNIEEYLTDHLNTPFPTMPYTQRPDRFCQALLEGRVGLMADGLPFAWMLPGTIDQFFQNRPGPGLPLDGGLRPERDPVVLRLCDHPGAGAVYRPGHLPPGGHPREAGPVHCGRQAGGALLHGVRGAHHAPGL